MVRGDSSEPDNPLMWDNIRLNLPVNPNYPLTVPCMTKVLGGTHELSVDFTIYVDDPRVVTGPS